LCRYGEEAAVDDEAEAAAMEGADEVSFVSQLINLGRC
jgi:hypothetical protein